MSLGTLPLRQAQGQGDSKDLQRQFQWRSNRFGRSDGLERGEGNEGVKISGGMLNKAHYNCFVRRFLSIVLLLVFSLPLISPVLALAAGSDANLPACCRRAGVHRCVRTMRPVGSSSETSVSAVPQRCPAYPAVVTLVRHGDLSFHAASLVFAGALSHPTVKPQVAARARVALDRSRQKRGPPADIL